MQAGFMQVMYMSEVGCAGGPSEQHLPHLKRTSTTQVISQFFKRIPKSGFVYGVSLIFKVGN